MFAFEEIKNEENFFKVNSDDCKWQRTEEIKKIPPNKNNKKSVTKQFREYVRGGKSTRKSVQKD